MIVLVDNYDSFAHNLARLIRQLGQDVQVIRNDSISVEELVSVKPQAIIISPGPCTPDEAGVCLDLVKHCFKTTPVFGVCLGHQVICQAFGGRIVRVPPVHGRSSDVNHFGHALFQGIESPFLAGRYHSLVVEHSSMPDELQIISQSDDEIAMAVCHRQYPVVGVQFHPESILTRCGYRLLGNFLHMAGITVDQSLVGKLTDRLAEQTSQPAHSGSTRQSGMNSSSSLEYGVNP